MNGAGSKAECLEALIRLPAVGLYARPRTVQFVHPQSWYTGANQRGGGGKAGRPIFIGKQYL